MSHFESIPSSQHTRSLQRFKARAISWSSALLHVSPTVVVVVVVIAVEHVAHLSAGRDPSNVSLSASTQAASALLIVSPRNVPRRQTFLQKPTVLGLCVLVQPDSPTQMPF